MAAFVSLGVVADLALAVRVAWNDRDYAVIAQMLSQAVGVVSLVGEQVSCPLQACQQRRRYRAVCRVAAAQHEGKGTPDHIREDMDFGGLPAAGRPDSLIFRPPLPPCIA